MNDELDSLVKEGVHGHFDFKREEREPELPRNHGYLAIGNVWKLTTLKTLAASFKPPHYITA